MRIFIIAAAAAAAAVAAASPVAAQSPFDGTWKADTSKDEFGGKPISFALKDGTFECRSCATPYKVTADGRFHPVTGQPYADAVAVRVVDPRTVERRFRKGDKMMETVTERVSADRRTATYEGTDMSAANGTPVAFKGTRVRVGAPPAGGHPISGEWRNQKGATVSDAGLTLDFATTADTISYSSPLGERYTAPIGGAPVPIEGDPAGTMMKVERVGPQALRFTSMRGGEPVSVGVLTVAADGRTAVFESRGVKTGSTGRFFLNKQ